MTDGLRGGVWYGRLSSRIVLGDASYTPSSLEAAAADDGYRVLSIIPTNPRYNEIRTTPRCRAEMSRFHVED